MRGRVMGIWTLIFGGMIPLGSLQAGFMADLLGTPATIAIGALICALAALVTLKSSPPGSVASRLDAISLTNGGGQN